MTLDQILTDWTEDSELDIIEIDEEARKTVSLHSKYIRLYSIENLNKIKLETQFKRLKLEKFEYYFKGSTNETQAKGWKTISLPIIKPDIPMYLDADPEMIKASLELAYQNEKVDLLKDIIKQISTRNYIIKSVVDFKRFAKGG